MSIFIKNYIFNFKCNYLFPKYFPHHLKRFVFPPIKKRIDSGIDKDLDR